MNTTIQYLNWTNNKTITSHSLKKRVITLLILFSFSELLHSQPLTWENSVALCLQNNPKLKSVKETIQQKKYLEKNASKGYLPIFSTKYAVNQSELNGKKSNSNDAKITVSQTIYDGFETIYNTNAAKKSTIASTYAYRNESAKIRFSLRKAFIDILKYKELLIIEKTIKSRRKKQLELISIKYHSGSEHTGALFNAEASYLDASGSVLITQKNIELARKKFAYIIGINNLNNMIVTGSIQTTKLDDENTQEVAEKHPYINQLLHIKENKKLTLASIKSNAGLQINATINAGYSGDNFPLDNQTWSAGLTFSHPFWDWRMLQVNINRAKSELTQSIINERDAYFSILTQLEEAQANLSNTKIKLTIQKHYLKAIEERSKIADIQYSIGKLTYDNWIQIENELVSAKKSALNSKINVFIAQANWVYAKGGSLENE